ncbi:hypothetical protein N2152v2_004497 [Parachlorella kessleri]
MEEAHALAPASPGGQGLQEVESGLTEPLLAMPLEQVLATPTQEAYRLLSLGWPIVVEEVITFGSTVIAIGIVGRLGPLQLSIFSLARSVTNITGLSFLVGATGGIDTFCSQTHGAGTYRQVGVALQRGIYITLVACLPVLLLYTQADRLLALLGQDPDIAKAAGRYIRLYSPVLPLHGVVLCIYRYLLAQGAAAYVMVAGAVFFAATGPINSLLIFKLGLGLDGSALAAVACDVVYLVVLILLAAYHNLSKPPHIRPWQGWSWEAFLHWGPYLKVVVASIAMVVLDWWIADVATLLGGMLPDPETSLAAMGILYNLNALIFMLPFGLAFAVCARIGACLGAGQYKLAKLSAEVGTGMALSFMVIGAVVLLIARDSIARPFTHDEDVLAAAARIAPAMAVGLIAAAATAVQLGVMRGCGRQKYGALVNFFANWVLGLPLLILLAFKLKLGVAGLWWGQCIANYVQAMVLALMVARFDWTHESRRAGRLVRRLSQRE